MRARTTALLLAAALLAGCAHRPPDELLAARAAFEAASDGPAATLAPDEVARAAEALEAAEGAYAEKPRSYHTADLAYVAHRRAELASAIAVVNRSQAETEARHAEGAARLATAPAGDRQPAGAVLASLPADALFAPGAATLLAGAEPELERVAGALLGRAGGRFVVEARSAGDLALGRDRAEAVRAWLASRGYPAGSIETRVSEGDPTAADGLDVLALR